ncbi:hypothetical protein [Delftia acidovorans]
MTTTASPWVAKAAAAGLALAALMASGAAQARGDVQWSISLNSPGMYGPPVYVAPAPVYVAPPQPIYYAPPPPVYYAPRAVYRAPPVVVVPGYGYGYGGGYRGGYRGEYRHDHGHGHGHWRR